MAEIETKEKKPAPAKSESGTASRKTRSLDVAVLHIKSTFNNTLLLLTDDKGNAVVSASSGSLGFSGTKKGTPFAAAKVGEMIGDKAKELGVREVAVVIRGVGAGRESSIRAFAGKGVAISSIKDATPLPHNGPRPPRPRRV